MPLNGIPLSAGVVVGAPRPLDTKFGPFASVEEANNNIPIGIRHPGLTVGILEGNPVQIVEYWYKSLIGNAGLIKKTAVLDTSTAVLLDDLSDKTQNIPTATTFDKSTSINGAITDAIIDCGSY
jgi:hypothetical protein